MTFKFMNEIASLSIPDLAGSIVATRNKSVSNDVYLSPFLLKLQLVSGNTCALSVLKTLKC